MLIEGKKKKVMNIFKGQNIIATKRRIWTSVESNPLMADNKEYEQIFQEHEKVHFVLLEENIRQRRPNKNTAGKSLENFKLCNLYEIWKSLPKKEIYRLILLYYWD
jgi:hypothetical protein